MHDIDHIVRLRNLVDVYGLPRWPGFDRLTCAQLQRMYNGIGPSKFGDLVLDLSTSLFDVFEPAALVHDAAWTRVALGGDNDGMRVSFVIANKDFAAGCKIIADTSKLRFERFRPQQRDLRRFVGRQLARAVMTDTAWDAYRDAYTASTFGAAA